MKKIRIGVQLHPQHTSYQEFIRAAREADELGVDTLWTWDHFYPLYGDPAGAHLEGWTLLTAMAALTQRAEVGLLVACNSYRNPHLVADMARTIDHVSGGRSILGLGAGWFERDYDEYGYEFGTAPDRLRALKTNLPIIKDRLERLHPRPLRHPIPLMIGGGGEKVTLRLTAQYADLWNGFGPVDNFRHKNQVLDEWCRKLGRDPRQVERTVLLSDGPDEKAAEAFVEAGADQIILGLQTPFPLDGARRLLAWREARRAVSA